MKKVFGMEMLTAVVILLLTAGLGVYVFLNHSRLVDTDKQTKATVEPVKEEKPAENTTVTEETKPATDPQPTTTNTVTVPAATTYQQPAECYKVYPESMCLNKIEYDAVIELQKVKSLGQ